MFKRNENRFNGLVLKTKQQEAFQLSGTGQFPPEQFPPPPDNYPQLIAPEIISLSDNYPHANCPPDSQPPDNYPLRQFFPGQFPPMPIAPWTISPVQFPPVPISPCHLLPPIKLPPTGQFS